MSITEPDAQMVEHYLNQIFGQISPAMTDRDRFQVRRYIDAREYGLALDDMADILLESDKPVPPELRSLFDAAAAKMDIKPGAGWSGVDTIFTTKHATS